MFTKTFAAGAAVLFLSVAALPAGASETELEFTVLRDGDPIGTHSIEIDREAGRTDVDIRTDVAVKLAFVTVYNFNHEGHETWREGRLVAYESKTDDDGTDKSLRARATGGRLVVDGSAAKYEAEPAIVPASLWNPQTVSQSRLLNTLDGSEMAVKVTDAGEETVQVRGEPVKARHYAIEGELNREVWYDAGGTLVKVRFSADDGSDIQYLLR